MKCTSKKLICLFLVLGLFLTGCGAGTQAKLPNSYNPYSYNTSFTNQNTAVNADYFASDLCVTESINFGTENTYYEVAGGSGVFNVTEQEVMYNHNMFAKLYPASTTKILTAYIILRDCDLNDMVTVSESAADQASDSSVCGVKAGDVISVNDLLYGLMLSSGNDAAEALAEHHSGTLEAFAEVMNETAYGLGATNSHFMNPSGLSDSEHYTTVYDMYLIFNEALKYDKFVEIISSSTHKAIITSSSGTAQEKLFYNSNKYLAGTVESPRGITVVGGKTGTTFAAKYCLVLYSLNEDGDQIISIVFKADSSHNLYLLMNQILSKYAK